jgi:hypothetical protein
MSGELNPHWMRSDGFDENITYSSEFAFPTDLVCRTMDSVANQFNPNPPAPRQDIVANLEFIERKKLFLSSSVQYYTDLNECTQKNLKENILNHRCTSYGDPIHSSKVIIIAKIDID